MRRATASRTLLQARAVPKPSPLRCRVRQREEKYLFSTKPYFKNKIVLVTAPNNTGIKTVDDLGSKKVPAGAGRANAQFMESYNKEHADNPIDIRYTDADASAALIDLYNGRYDDIMNLFKPSAIWEGIVRIVPNIPQTLDIAAVAAVIGIVLGFLLALFRIKKFPVLSQFATLYISFMRGTPLLVQLFLSYYGIPVMLNILNYKFGREFSVNDIPSMLFVFVTFSLNEAAYMAESIRAAILSVDRKDIEAACWMLSVRLRIRA